METREELKLENKRLKAELAEANKKLVLLAGFIASKTSEKAPRKKTRSRMGLSWPQMKAVLMAGAGFLELGQGEVNLNHFYYGGNLPIKTEEDKKRGFGEVESVSRRTIDELVKKGLAYFENGAVEVYLTEKGEQVYQRLLTMEGYTHPPKHKRR